jgi:hypothetical protein
MARPLSKYSELVVTRFKVNTNIQHTPAKLHLANCNSFLKHFILHTQCNTFEESSQNQLRCEASRVFFFFLLTFLWLPSVVFCLTVMCMSCMVLCLEDFEIWHAEKGNYNACVELKSLGAYPVVASFICFGQCTCCLVSFSFFPGLWFCGDVIYQANAWCLLTVQAWCQKFCRTPSGFRDQKIVLLFCRLTISPVKPSELLFKQFLSNNFVFY